jgi:hypothetical protein
MGRGLALGFMLAVLVGCATAFKTAALFCDHAEVIRPTQKDVEIISDRLVEQIVRHNEVGQRLCGWKP